jgi:putative transposase
MERCKKEKGIVKQQKRILNIVDDLHWKLCHRLLSGYNKVIIPSLYIRKPMKQDKRIQNDMRHCQFVTRLIYKSVEYSNAEIHHCKEYSTSETCTRCGSLKTIKGDIVQCKVCDFTIHRDVSGSRNISIKHLKI